jgi:Flp pilus assembly protein TadD
VAVVKVRPWLQFRRAQAYHLRGACRKAAALYAQVLSACPADHGALLWRGLALAECGDYAGACREIEKAMALRPEAAAGRIFLARVLCDWGRWNEARAILVEGLAGQENQQAAGLLALCHLRAGDLEAARQIIARGLPHAPWLLGRLLAGLEEKAAPASGPEQNPAERPLQVFHRGGRRDLRRGLLYLRAEKWQKALDAFQRAHAALPKDPRVAYGLGVSLYYLEKFEESRRVLEAAGDLDEPFASDAQAALGKAVLELGDARRALLLLRRAIAHGAATPENYYALGLALLRSGRPVPARKAFEKCATPAFVRQRLAGISSPQPPD